MQRALRYIFPPHCISCAADVDNEFSLCANCWRETPFISGLVCDACGTPLPGDETLGIVFCDTCLITKRPWKRGRAAMIYKDNARKMVLALKHGDRQELARPAARWLLGVAKPLVSPDTIVLPVPAHWSRLLRRRYNQAALLAKHFATLAGLESIPDALIRARSTPIQDGLGIEARFANLSDCLKPHPKNGHRLCGKSVLIVDDVMTSGATFSAATEACHNAGATQVCVLALARVDKST